MKMFRKVIVANRGEIACRVMRTLREEGIASVALYSDVDADAPHRWLADEAYAVEDVRGYLDIDKVVGLAKDCGADALHPGYGFLSENPKFVAACEKAGICFIGPTSHTMELFGDKSRAREVAQEAGVACIPGAKQCSNPEEARRSAQALGLPVLLKAAGGGGGKGMRRVDRLEEIDDAFASATRESLAAFNNPILLLEHYIHPARHIEVQIMGDGKKAVAYGERECSLQRRYQKVIEEAPASCVSDALRERLRNDAIILAEKVGYRGAGTVEFLVGPDDLHYFLEINTRLQVEHPITEEIFGVDLVREQLRVAQGGKVLPPQPSRGFAIEARLNAEDAYAGHLPQSGHLAMLQWPHMPRVRIDSGVVEGDDVSPHYDSMLAKVIAVGQTREEARLRLHAALEKTFILGVVTNRDFLMQILSENFFIDQQTFTTTLEEQEWKAPRVPEFLEGLIKTQSGVVGRSGVVASDPDPYSPWHSLKGFRSGQ
jgi:acetyl/propionyl-CoA carboxylase alpha subunit